MTHPDLLPEELELLHAKLNLETAEITWTELQRFFAQGVLYAVDASVDLIDVAYAIGVAHPVSVMVDSFGTGTVSDEILAKAVEQVFDLRPAAIIQRLDLRRPIYRQLAAYGHMGREDLSVAWEKTDRTEELKQAVKALQ